MPTKTHVINGILVWIYVNEYNMFIYKSQSPFDKKVR